MIIITSTARNAFFEADATILRKDFENLELTVVFENENQMVYIKDSVIGIIDEENKIYYNVGQSSGDDFRQLTGGKCLCPITCSLIDDYEYTTIQKGTALAGQDFTDRLTKSEYCHFWNKDLTKAQDLNILIEGTTYLINSLFYGLTSCRFERIAGVHYLEQFPVGRCVVTPRADVNQNYTFPVSKVFTKQANSVTIKNECQYISIT